ncbi:MAG: hypothetical protein JWN40_5529, partial [Phycisphaerales bacterium]|nr:hypothetical protein [Phycisphaerales bacterium]
GEGGRKDDCAIATQKNEAAPTLWYNP